MLLYWKAEVISLRLMWFCMYYMSFYLSVNCVYKVFIFTVYGEVNCSYQGWCCQDGIHPSMSLLATRLLCKFSQSECELDCRPLPPTTCRTSCTVDSAVYDEFVMVKTCSWGSCNSDSRYPERLENDMMFLPFLKPKTNPEICLRWIKACGETPSAAKHQKHRPP